MKKFILGAVMVIGFASLSSAQKVADPATAKVPAKKVTAAKPAGKAIATAAPQGKKAAPVKAVVATPVVNAAPPTATAPAAKNGVVIKKDGTPDKRYSNATAKVKGPLKKDGTADKRFKANKKG